MRDFKDSSARFPGSRQVVAVLSAVAAGAAAIMALRYADPETPRALYAVVGLMTALATWQNVCDAPFGRRAERREAGAPAATAAE